MAVEDPDGAGALSLLLGEALQAGNHVLAAIRAEVALNHEDILQADPQLMHEWRAARRAVEAAGMEYCQATALFRTSVQAAVRSSLHDEIPELSREIKAAVPSG